MYPLVFIPFNWALISISADRLLLYSYVFDFLELILLIATEVAKWYTDQTV